MAYLVDTSILVRLANTADKQYIFAAEATHVLYHRGEILNITAQNLIEFRNVATRPAGNNGLGLTPNAARAKAEKFEASMPLLPETDAIFPIWKAIVDSLGIIGKQVHDVRLVAICHVHSIPNILTFNTKHFSSLANYGSGIQVVDPASVGGK